MLRVCGRTFDPYGWALSPSLLLVAIVGVLEAVTPFLIGLIFDTLLRGSAAPSITIPMIAPRFDVAALDGRIFLAMLIGVTVVKTSAEYGSIAAIAFLGHAVVRDLRNDAFKVKSFFEPTSFLSFQSHG